MNRDRSPMEYLFYKETSSPPIFPNKAPNQIVSDNEKEYIELKIEHQITNLITSDIIAKRPCSQ